MRVLIVLSMLVLGSLAALAAEFHNDDKHYTLRYDETRLKLVSPGQLATDLVLYTQSVEAGFYPNLTIASQPLPAGFKFEEAVASTRRQYHSAFPGAELSQDSAMVWKGFKGHLFELRYARAPHALFLRTLLVQTPTLVLSLNITSPVASKDSHMATFMAVLDTLEIHPWPANN